MNHCIFRFMNKRSGNIFVIVGILAVLAFLLLHFLAHWSQAWLVFPVFALVGCLVYFTRKP